MEKAEKNILILGAGGMLAESILAQLKGGYSIVALKHKDCDITDKDKLSKIFRRFRPWLVINTAAYKDVDGCEIDKRRAYKVNAEGARNVAETSKFWRSILIHISTDYVFDGKKTRPYRETDRTGPLSIYGKSKLRGEELVRHLLDKYIIIRTCWLFGKGKNNFVNSILEKAKTTKNLQIVSDKFATPTYVNDLAGAIREIISLLEGVAWQRQHYGIYHISNSGSCSWYTYAKSILELAKIKDVEIKPIKMSEICFKARRPAFSVLDNSKYIKLTKRPLRPWQEALKDYICSYN